jgi:hypothetical protein
MPPNLTSADDEIAKELARIEEDCIHSGKAHFCAQERWSAYHYWLGIPAVIFSSIAGFAFIQKYPEIGGAISVFVAVLTALSTFLKPHERAAAHKSSGDQYLSLRNDARVFRTIKLANAGDVQSALSGLDEYAKRRNDLNQASPQFSNRDFIKARKGIEVGEATHAVDKVV